MKDELSFFTHGNVIIYLKSLQCKYIANGIARHCRKTMNGNNDVGKIWNECSLTDSKNGSRSLKLACNFDEGKSERHKQSWRKYLKVTRDVAKVDVWKEPITSNLKPGPIEKC